MPIIMLSGPIGAGKTTVARELLALLPAPLSYIEGDTFWSLFINGGSTTRREQFGIAMRSMTAAALPFARSGYTVLLDFSFPPYFLPTALKILKEVPLEFVVIRPSLTVCQARAAQRSKGAIADYASYRDFYALFEDNDSRTVCDDDSDAPAIAKRIRDGLDTGIFRVTSRLE